VAAGDIVFNITIDTPQLTLPNLQIVGYNVDMVPPAAQACACVRVHSCWLMADGAHIRD
jgi:hypothetical protein